MSHVKLKPITDSPNDKARYRNQRSKPLGRRGSLIYAQLYLTNQLFRYKDGFAEILIYCYCDRWLCLFCLFCTKLTTQGFSTGANSEPNSGPIVLIVFGGDITTLQTVADAMEKKIPAIIVKVSVLRPCHGKLEVFSAK